MVTIEWLLLIAGILLIISAFASKISDLLGFPVLVLFLAIGMLAGSDGPGGIYFDNAAWAQAIGVIALAYILFSGGLDTPLARVKPVIGGGLSLASIGVLVTALVAGLFAAWILSLSLLEGMLLGAVIASTDAAAVFSILRSNSLRLRGDIEPLLELESGSNDPMAVILTVSLLALLANPATSVVVLLGNLIRQIAIGVLVGYLAGRLGVALINSIRIKQEGLYSTITLALVALTYAGATLVGGSGILAVYLAGIVMGNSEFLHKNSLVRFHDGLAWLMQIAMFITLGLLVFPSRLPAVAVASLAITAVLIFIARPVAVWVSLALSRYTVREKLFVSWVGLRGATPIILATFPLLAQVPAAQTIFDVVFFVVITSVLLQGTVIARVAHWLKLIEPNAPATTSATTLTEKMIERVQEVELKATSRSINKRILDLHLPADIRLVLIERAGQQIIPSGSTTLLAGDRVLLTMEEAADRQRGELLLNSADQVR